MSNNNQSTLRHELIKKHRMATKNLLNLDALHSIIHIYNGTHIVAERINTATNHSTGLGGLTPRDRQHAIK